MTHCDQCIEILYIDCQCSGGGEKSPSPISYPEDISGWSF